MGLTIVPANDDRSYGPSPSGQGNRFRLTGAALAEEYDSWVASMIRSSPCPVHPDRASVLDHFSTLSDPRQRWRVLYLLPEILLLVLCATLSGKEDFVEIRLCGEQRLDFLRRVRGTSQFDFKIVIRSTSSSVISSPVRS
jgi:hypothetical protein